MNFTVLIAQDEERWHKEIFITYLRKGEKIALAAMTPTSHVDIANWVLDGKMPKNGTFYKF